MFATSEQQLNATIGAFREANALVGEADEQAEALGETKRSLAERIAGFETSTQEYGRTINEINAAIDGLVTDLTKTTSLTADAIITPFDVKVNPLTAKRSNLDYLFPTVLVLVTLFVSVLLGVTIMNKERASRAHFRNFITPAPDWLFILGIFLTCVAITIVQIIISAISSPQSALSRSGSDSGMRFFSLFGGIVLAAMTFSILGILIGSLGTNEETTTLAGIIVCMIAFLFSGSVIPIESMSTLPRMIVQVNPFFLFEDLFRRQIIFGASLFSAPWRL